MLKGETDGKNEKAKQRHPEILKKYYCQSELYESLSNHVFPLTENTRREKIFRPRVERLIDICSQLHVNKDLLIEVGPGFGTFSELIMETGFFTKVIAVGRP